MKKFAVLIFILCSSLVLKAQVSLEDVKKDPRISANNLRAYPVEEIGEISKPPKGYRPFYAYYIGRHGSRYLTRQSMYDNTLSIFEKAAADSALTDVGTDVLRRLRVIAADAAGKAGHLTRTGQRQLYGMAERMYGNFPEIFSRKDLEIHAISTDVHRVIGTMEAFCSRMEELNPSADITTTVGSDIYGEWGSDIPEAGDYDNADTPYGKRHKELCASTYQPDRLMTVLFSDPDYPDRKGMDKTYLMDTLFEIAGVAQSVDLEYLDYNLYDIFTAEELYKLSVIRNFEHYVRYGSSPETSAVINHIIHKPMELMIERAENAWKDGTDDAFFVFCHDGNIGRYSPALGIPWAYDDSAVEPEDICSVYYDGKVVPMAANLQFIFYRNRRGKVLVKVMLNEREAVLPVGMKGTPYNDWETFKEFVLNK